MMVYFKFFAPKEDKEIENFINYLKNLKDNSNWRKIFVEYLEKHPEGKKNLRKMWEIVKNNKSSGEILKVVDVIQYHLTLSTEWKSGKGHSIRQYLRKTLPNQIRRYMEKNNIY